MVDKLNSTTKGGKKQNVIFNNVFIITNLIHKFLVHSHKLYKIKFPWNISFACLALQILIFAWSCIIV